MAELVHVALFCTGCGHDLGQFSASIEAVADGTHEDVYRRLYWAAERTVGDVLRTTLCPGCGAPARLDVEKPLSLTQIEAIVDELDELTRDLDALDEGKPT
jgi:hypothetical protein